MPVVALRELGAVAYRSRVHSAVPCRPEEIVRMSGELAAAEEATVTVRCLHLDRQWALDAG